MKKEAPFSFEVRTLTGEPLTGNGLGNIERRATEIGYGVSIKSASGEGTVTALTK